MADPQVLTDADREAIRESVARHFRNAEERGERYTDDSYTIGRRGDE
jgi:hypothetical protein